MPSQLSLRVLELFLLKGRTPLLVACKYSNNEYAVPQYDANISSTAKVVPCGKCEMCSNDNRSCSYNVTYGDGSITSRFFVRDRLLLNANASSISLTFGCSTYRYGNVADEEFVGMLGFGPGAPSLPSQMNLNAFSYCVKGQNNGEGSYSVLGEVLQSSLVYTPLVPSMPHYNLHLESISVNNKTLDIDPNIFKPSENNAGTIIDSGTTYLRLVENAYNALIYAIDVIVSPYKEDHRTRNGLECYEISTSTNEAFPNIDFKFASDATVLLKPENYILLSSGEADADLWCINIISNSGITIFGDVIFKDMIFVYDLARQRIGWTSYNCSIPVDELNLNFSII